MKKLSLVLLVALVAFAASVFAQDAVKPAHQEKAKTAEMKPADVKKEEHKAEVIKKDAKPAKKHHKMVKKAEAEKK